MASSRHMEREAVEGMTKRLLGSDGRTEDGVGSAGADRPVQVLRNSQQSRTVVSCFEE